MTHPPMCTHPCAPMCTVRSQHPKVEEVGNLHKEASPSTAPIDPVPRVAQMEMVHLVPTGSMYSHRVKALFQQFESSASTAIRFVDIKSHNIDPNAVMVAIDGDQSSCSLLRLEALPPCHYVRIAMGGKQCSGVFLNTDVSLCPFSHIFIHLFLLEGHH